MPSSGLILALALGGSCMGAPCEGLPAGGPWGLAPDSLLTVTVTDLTPRFLEFYRKARAEGADPDRRWALWREGYGFAAVPPTARGMALARRQLDESWEGYEGEMDRIRAGAEGMEPAPESILRRVSEFLELDRPLDVELVVFVGSRGGGAFSMSLGDQWRVALPVQQDGAAREISASHEFTHAVHARLAGMEGTWARSVGQLVLGEGIAMRTAAALYPGRPESAYLGGAGDWMEEAAARESEILEGVLGSVDNATSRATERFTLGPGPAGMPREAYYAGWRLVGHLLDSGWTLPGLARVPRGFAGRIVEEGLREMLAEREGEGPTTRAHSAGPGGTRTEGDGS